MKFTDAQKKVIVARHENGESVRSLCSEFNIPRSTFYRWCKRTPLPTAYYPSQREKSIKCRIAL